MCRSGRLLSMRRSYIDWLIRKLEPTIDSTIGFYDGQVKGVYDLRMTDFGLKAPSLMMGTMKVQDVVKVNFDLVLKS